MAKLNPKAKTYAQGDVNFTTLETFGKTAADVSTDHPLRLHERHLVLLEGEVTGHHHGFWWAQPLRFHDAALAAALVESDTIEPPARLYRDDKLAAALPLRAGAPVIGFLVLDEPQVVRHARLDGTPTHEHDDLRLPAGAYLVTGKQEQVAGDTRAVAD